VDLPEAAGPGDGGVGHVVLQPGPDAFDGVVMRAVAGAVEQLQPGMLLEVDGDRAGMVDAVVVAPMGVLVVKRAW
jgi:hypothetical protein